MARTPAARPGVRVERALGGLLERGSEGAKLRIEVLRRVDEGEATLSVELRTDLHASERPDGLDLRPLEPFVELGEGVFYVDATRLGNLKAAARRLQRRRVGMTIVDLRGELADEGGSLLAHYLDAAEILAVERVPAGPDRSGALPLSAAGERSRAAERPWLPGKLAVLIDGRTRGRAEAEALGFGQLERACLVGSASAGELAGSAQTWLPGGWRLRFSTTELRSPEGEALWARGVEPKLRARPGVDGLRRGADEVLEVAISAGLGITDDRVKRPSWGRIR
nr:S41 family peptidase [Pseudenhygromyxa sp. WMMC2535]